MMVMMMTTTAFFLVLLLVTRSDKEYQILWLVVCYCVMRVYEVCSFFLLFGALVVLTVAVVCCCVMRVYEVCSFFLLFGALVVRTNRFRSLDSHPSGSSGARLQ
jgi:hypothetical protein